MKKYNAERNRSVTYPPANYQKKLMCYCCWYASIDDIYTNEKLDGVYKKLSVRLRRIIKKGSVITHTIKELNDEIMEFDLSKDVIYCNTPNSCSQIIAFLRHFRNAVAHGRIEYKSKRFYFENRNDNDELTAKGVFCEDTISSIFKEIQLL